MTFKFVKKTNFKYGAKIQLNDEMEQEVPHLPSPPIEIKIESIADKLKFWLSPDARSDSKFSINLDDPENPETVNVTIGEN